MSEINRLLAELVSLLESSGLCENVRIVETSFFSAHQYAFKIRATIFSSRSFQIRIYYNHDHHDYSYQLFDQEALCRWDNAEHFPALKNFPHHHHTLDGKVVESTLTGNPETDLLIVLDSLKKLFDK